MFQWNAYTDDISGNLTCIDKTVKEINAEIALFVHQSLFHGKTWVTYKDTAKNHHEFKTLVPSTCIILRDIKERTAKNKGNLKYYTEKVKNKKKQNKNTSSCVSEDEEDDVDTKENEERINTISDGELL